jgi:branched-chain amino acid transport system ATP-binding protein
MVETGAAGGQAAPLLKVDGIETCYGLSQVLFGVSLAIMPGVVETLMGRYVMVMTSIVVSFM